MGCKDLLPIGTVVLLKGAEKKLMIFGVKQRQTEKNETYDYIGVAYPEGNMGPEAQFLFNHESIDKIVFRGYDNEEQAEFLEKLENYYKGR